MADWWFYRIGTPTEDRAAALSVARHVASTCCPATTRADLGLEWETSRLDALAALRPVLAGATATVETTTTAPSKVFEVLAERRPIRSWTVRQRAVAPDLGVAVHHRHGTGRSPALLALSLTWPEELPAAARRDALVDRLAVLPGTLLPPTASPAGIVDRFFAELGPASGRQGATLSRRGLVLELAAGAAGGAVQLAALPELWSPATPCHVVVGSDFDDGLVAALSGLGPTEAGVWVHPASDAVIDAVLPAVGTDWAQVDWTWDVQEGTARRLRAVRLSLNSTTYDRLPDPGRAAVLLLIDARPAGPAGPRPDELASQLAARAGLTAAYDGLA
jgi:hypothetical protein